MSKKESKYYQIRLSFNLNEKEDQEVFEHFIEDRQKPSKNIILALHNQLNNESRIMNRLDHIEFVLKNINLPLTLNKEKVSEKVSVNFDNIEISDFDFID